MRRRVARRGLAAGLALAACVCAPAGADVYWADAGRDTIGRASPDGLRVERTFVAGAVDPTGVALDGSSVYWSHGNRAGRIGRARRDGRRADHSFLSVGARPGGLASDGVRLYWTHTVFGAGHVGRAFVGPGPPPEAAFVATGASPCGVAIDPDKLYWANRGRPGSLGRSHGRSDVEQDFVRRTSDPCGVAVTESHVYWADRAGNRIGRAQLDGTRVQPRFLAASRPCGVAVDGRHVYWSTGRGTIGRATRAGTRVDQRFVERAGRPCGVAVDPTIRPVPRAHRFSATRVGRLGAIRALLLVNTSSSPFDVTRVRIAGVARRDFRVTGDGCTVNPVAAGGACLVNVRFAPTARGLRRARLRVASNAAGPPTEVRLSGLAGG